MYFELLPPADQLVMIMERIYGYGMTTTSGGNLSILDENGDIWITPGGVDKGSLIKSDENREKNTWGALHNCSRSVAVHAARHKRAQGSGCR